MSTTSFIELPVELNGAALKSEIFAVMEEAFPGWEPNPNNPETWLIEGMVDRLTIPLAQMTADVAAEIFNAFGEQIVKVLPIEATPATVKSTWTMVDKKGYAIKVGTQVNVPTSGNTGEGFRVVNEVVVPKESLSTEAGGVLLEAIEPGTGANGLSGEAKLEDTLNYIAVEGGIMLVGESTGGTEAEEPSAYLDRLAETMRTLAPRPIIPTDVEILARNIPGVERAVALDMYNPETDPPEEPSKWLSERTCSVAVCDSEGEPCSELVKAAVLADLEARREVNFVFKVLDGTYTTIAAHYKVVPRAGFAQATADEATKAALEDLLAPNKFGVDQSGDLRSWNNQTVLRYQDLVTVVSNLQSVDHYTVLKVAKEGSELKANTDIALAGPAALTKPGKIEIGS